MVNLELNPQEFYIWTSNGTIVRVNGDKTCHNGVNGVNGTVGSLKNKKITVSVNSSGAVAGSYDLKVNIRSRSSLKANSTQQPIMENSIPVSVVIDAIPDANRSVVRVIGGPTLEKDWDGVSIWPRDLDGHSVSSNTGANFEVFLERDGTEAACKVARGQSDLSYSVNCAVPDSDSAGIWTLSVTLDDEAIFTRKLRALCQAGKFENADGECDPCLDGALCEEEGTTLATLTVMQGYWRSGVDSEYIYVCPSVHACPGSSGPSSGGGCRIGFIGPTCATCESNFFFSWSGKTCEPCEKGSSHLASVVVASCIILLFGGVAVLNFVAGSVVVENQEQQQQEVTTPVKRERSVFVDKAQTTLDGLYLFYDTAGVKMFTLFVTAQVLYQFTAVTSASSESEDIRYPEPAASFVGGLGIFNLEMFSYVPAECIFAHTDFCKLRCQWLPFWLCFGCAVMMLLFS